MKKLLVSLLAFVLALSLSACGGSDSEDTTEKEDTNTVDTKEENTKEVTGSYTYIPPTDNYKVVWDDNGNEQYVAKIGMQVAYTPTEDMIGFIDYNAGAGWSRELTGNEWYSDDYDYSQEPMSDDLGLLSSMEDYFMDYYRGYGFEDSELLERYGVGTEEVVGVDCWIIDTDGHNAIYMKFWIDPSNGCCLKVEDENGEVEEVTTYNLNYTSFEDGMKP
jgi:hypothetical protein